MKITTLLAALVVLVSLPQSFAEEFKNSDYKSISSIQSKKTPFQMMEKLYSETSTMSAGQFPASTDPTLAQWHCMGATEDKKAEELNVYNEMYFFIRGEKEYAFGNFQTGSSSTLTLDSVPQKSVQPNMDISYAPDFMLSGLSDDQDSSSFMKLVFQINTERGFIMIKETSDPSKSAKVNRYTFCWKE